MLHELYREKVASAAGVVRRRIIAERLGARAPGLPTANPDIYEAKIRAMKAVRQSAINTPLPPALASLREKLRPQGPLPKLKALIQSKLN